MSTVTVDKSVDIYMRYHKQNSRPNSIRAFGYTLEKFKDLFSGMDITKIPESDVLTFLEMITDGLSQGTKSHRAGHLSAMFNFVADTFDLDFRNPCSRGIIKKLYKPPRHTPPELLDKEIIDEIIYRAKGMDRHVLELMGRTGMRIGEVLHIKPIDLNTEVSTIAIEQPKSGRAGEVVYIPKKMMSKLEEYVRDNSIKPRSRIFPRSYTTIYRMVKKRGNEVGVRLRPHDLRRHAATQASRSGIPLEMVSKVILRHADIATTQRYLGKVSTAEASRMIEGLLG